MSMLFGLLLVASYAIVEARGQWYLTGNKFNDERASSIYNKEVIDIWEYTENPHLRINDSHTSFGGALAVYVGYNSSLDPPLVELAHELLRHRCKDEYTLDVTGVWLYNTFVTVTHEAPLEYEIGLFDRARNEFTTKAIHQVKLGKEWRVRFTSRCTTSEPSTSTVEAAEVHRVSFVADLHGTITVGQHIWELAPSDQSSQTDPNPGDDKGVTTQPLRVMTYNIWHNNPPDWLIHNRVKRWSWYVKRLRHMAKIIIDEDPDVLTLQEVRLDNTFSSGAPPRKPPSSEQGNDTNTSQDLAVFSTPTGSQLHHIVRHLQQEQLIRAGAVLREKVEGYELSVDGDFSPTGEGEDDTLLWPEGPSSGQLLGALDEVYASLNSYQIVYQPAMSMYDRNHMGKRIEEGVAILVKSGPRGHNAAGGLFVSHAKALFLPRDFENKYDDHHRVVLHVEIGLRPSQPDRPTLRFDVMTTHLSLSSLAREKSVQAIWTYVKNNCSGIAQILTGDFNAEPNEAAFGFLTGSTPLASSEDAEDLSVGNFRDAWGSSRESLTGSDDAHGYTFPPCNPEKRIDFILVRNSSTVTPNRWIVEVMDTRITGRDPTSDTMHLVRGREGLGMLDNDSPIWASDHFAVVSDLKLVYL